LHQILKKEPYHDLPWLFTGGLSKDVAWFSGGISRWRFRLDKSLLPKILSIGQNADGAGIT